MRDGGLRGPNWRLRLSRHVGRNVRRDAEQGGRDERATTGASAGWISGTPACSPVGNLLSPALSPTSVGEGEWKRGVIHGRNARFLSGVLALQLSHGSRGEREDNEEIQPARFKAGWCGSRVFNLHQFGRDWVFFGLEGRNGQDGTDGRGDSVFRGRTEARPGWSFFRISAYGLLRVLPLWLGI
jgi:hypothetical protein